MKTGPQSRSDTPGTDIEYTTSFDINTGWQVVLVELVCSGSAPLITMMQPTNFRHRDDPSSVWAVGSDGIPGCLSPAPNVFGCVVDPTRKLRQPVS